MSPVPMLRGRLPPGAHLARLAGHPTTVECLAFSPDGQWLLSTSSDGTVLVWDVGTGEIVHHIEEKNGICACAFFPSGDRIVTAGWDGVLTVRDVLTARPLWQFGKPAEFDHISRLAVRADGREILTGSSLGKVTAWSMAAGDFGTTRALGNLRNAVRSVGYASDGAWYVTNSLGEFYVWDKVAGLVKVPGGGVYSAAHVVGPLFAVGYQNGLDILRADGTAQRMFESAFPTTTLAAHPASGRLFASELAQDRGGIWSLADQKRLCALKEVGRPSSAAFRPQGDLVAVGGNDGLIRLIDAETCTLRVRLGGDRSRIASVTPSNDGRWVALTDSSGQLTVWNASTWTLEDRQWISDGLSKTVPLDGRRFLVIDGDGRIILSDTNGTSVIGNQPGGASSLAVSPDGRSAYVGGWHGRLNRWDLTSGESTKLLDLGADVWITNVQARRLAPASDTHDLIVTTRREQSQIHRIGFGPDGASDNLIPLTEGSSGSLQGVDATDDGRRIIEVYTSGSIYVRDGSSGKLLVPLKGMSQDFGGSVGSNAHYFAVVADTLLRWPLESTAGEPDVRMSLGITSNTLGVAIDEKYLLVGTQDGRALVRALPDAHAVAELVPTRDGGWATIFADGSFVASAGAAQGLRVESGTSSRRVWTLGDLARRSQSLHVRIGERRFVRSNDGAIAVQFAVVAPCGPPTVSLDGWPVRVLAGSDSAAAAYLGEVSLFEPLPSSHVLTARDACSSETVRFVTPPDPQMARATERARVLAIGVSNYQRFAGLPGATQDAAKIAAAFRDPSSWGLDETRSRALFDLTEPALRTAVKRFLTAATPNETLFLYLAGHSRITDGKQYLLGTNAKQKGGALSIADLWTWLRGSAATQVVVLIDACNAGGSDTSGSRSLPTTGARVVITSTAADAPARETKDGGLFTQAFLGALKSEQRADPSGAVTLYSAIAHAQDSVSSQYPSVIWSGESASLQRLALAYPRAARAPVTQAKGEQGAQGMKVEYELQAMRQVAAGKDVEVSSHQIKMQVYLDSPAWLRFSIFPEFGNHPLFQEHIAGDQREDHTKTAYSPGTASVSVPLRKLPMGSPTKYRGRLEACEQVGASFDCERHPAVEFSFTYPPHK